jgi:hypothetical protein
MGCISKLEPLFCLSLVPSGRWSGEGVLYLKGLACNIIWASRFLFTNPFRGSRI